ncbi:MAG: AzlC family ABC transporter permease [Lachnospiraceae bacterium]|nr:AzlC family ABC transporter permease [Lachnospiraceae bacterium]
MGKIKYAFVKSFPVMCGYIFLGIAFGVVLTDAGFNPLWALFMSGAVYAGSMQFVMVPLMATGASLVTMAVTTLFVNVRHVFYGLSFTESFKKLKSKPYMIFGLTDETYSVLCGCKNEDPDEEKIDTWPLITLFDQLYWVTGSILGAILGSFIPWDLTGIDFSMTALFVVILVDQIRKNVRIAGPTALMGGISAVICLFIFGTDKFLLPTLIITVLLSGTFSVVMAGKGAQHE